MYCFNCLSNVITPCRIWLSLGLCCFLWGWKTPFLEGNPRRRFPKQKPTSSRNLKTHSARSSRVVSWLIIMPALHFPRIWLGRLSGSLQISPPTSIVGVASVSHGLHIILCIYTYILFFWLTLGTIFQLLNLSTKRGKND